MTCAGSQSKHTVTNNQILFVFDHMTVVLSTDRTSQGGGEASHRPCLSADAVGLISDARHADQKAAGMTQKYHLGHWDALG